MIGHLFAATLTACAVPASVGRPPSTKDEGVKATVWTTWRQNHDLATVTVTEVATDSELRVMARRCVTKGSNVCIAALPHGWAFFTDWQWMTPDSVEVTMRAFTVRVPYPTTVGVNSTSWLVVRHHGQWKASDLGSVSIDDYSEPRTPN